MYRTSVTGLGFRLGGLYIRIYINIPETCRGLGRRALRERLAADRPGTGSVGDSVGEGTAVGITLFPFYRDPLGD